MKKFLIPLFLFSVVFLISAAPPILRQFGTTNTPTSLTNVIISISGGNILTSAPNWNVGLTQPSNTIVLGNEYYLGQNKYEDIIKIFHDDSLDDSHDSTLVDITRWTGKTDYQIAFSLSLQPVGAASANSSGSDALYITSSMPGKGGKLLYFGGGAAGVASIAGADQTIAGSQVAGIFGLARGYDPIQVGVAGTARPQDNALTNIGVAASSIIGGNSGQFVGLYGEITANATTDPIYQSSVLLLDGRSSELPVITARTNNGTSVAVLSKDGVWTSSAYFISGTTNQIKFGATNTAPSSAVAPTKWVSVQVQGETAVYRLPLYE